MDEYEKHRSFRDTLYGKVRHGVHKKTGTHVIIKEYNKIQVQRKITADGQLIAEDAQEEIRIHAKLVTNGGEAHPYIVQMYDVQQDADRIYTILEYCAKGEFFPFVQHADFTEALTRHYFAQLMEGVAYLHDKEVCHRDLSLENILLDGNDVLKICDFGLAMEAKEGTIVTDGQAVGKQKYMAPEVFGGHEYDPRKADMWSCGIILFVMLVRAFPYELPTSGDARFVWVYSGRIAQLLQSWGRVLPADAIDLLNRLLCPPDRRLTARQVLAHPFCQQLTRSQAQPQTDASMFTIQDVNQNTPQSPLPPQQQHQQHQQHQQQHQQQQQYYHHQLATSSPTATASSTSTSSSSTSWLTSCACGGQYDHTFVYCPSCNAVNPMALGSSHHSHETSTSGSSTLSSAAIVDDTKHPSPSPSPPQHQEYAQYGAASVTSSPAYASPHIHASSSSHQASGRPPDTDMDTTMR